jgi:hypothetical protein
MWRNKSSGQPHKYIQDMGFSDRAPGAPQRAGTLALPKR